MNKVPWYNKSINSSLHGRLFEIVLKHSITNGYNLMCYIVTHDKKQPSYEDDESSIGYRIIHRNVTTEKL